jgi:excisionase family DNA binding protein
MEDFKNDPFFKLLCELFNDLPKDGQKAFFQTIKATPKKEEEFSKIPSRVKDAYSPKEFAERMGVTVGTVRRWLRNGELRGTKISRTWLIPHAELDRVRRGGTPMENPGEGGGVLKTES